MSKIEGFSNYAAQGDNARGLDRGGGARGRGEFEGMLIEVEDEAMLITESAEELSLFNSSKAESKNAAERKKDTMRSLERMSKDEVAECMEASETFENAEEEAMFAHLMLAGRQDPGRLARQKFGRASDQFLALQYALNKGEEEGADGEVLDAIREALDDLDMEAGPQIRADLNTLGAASEGMGSKEELQEFQQTYTDIVLGEPTLVGTLSLALSRFGPKDFAVGMDRLVKALGQDVAAARSSCDPTRLQNLIQDLYHLRVVATVLDSAKELFAQLAARHGSLGGDAVALTKELVTLSSEKWVAGSRFATLVEKQGARTTEAQIHMLTGLKSLMRSMPERVFVDADQRQGVLNALQDALDKAIEREEEGG